MFCQTFKVEEKKVSLVFWCMAQEPRYWYFAHLTIPRTSLPKVQKTQWPYFGSWATNQKTKDTFFFSTLKVWDSKVFLVFFIYGPGAKILAFSPLDDGMSSTSWGLKEENHILLNLDNRKISIYIIYILLCLILFIIVYFDND